MSAPTPAPGDDRPREGYYPDPSIPGYVRYWNGASWVPGTSRPAPENGEPLTPPPGARPAPPSVEETGPHFFDEDPPDGEQPGGAPDRQGGRPVHGEQGAPGAQWGRPGEPRGVDPRLPAESSDGRATARTDGTAAIPPARDDPHDPGTFIFRRPIPGPAAADRTDDGTMTFRPVPPAPPGPSGTDSGPAGSGAQGPAGAPAHSGFGAGKAAAARAAAAQTPPAAQGPQAPSIPQPAAAPQPSPAVPAPAPALAAPSVPHQAGPGQAGAPATPLTSGPGGGQTSWAQQVHRLAGGGNDQPVAPWKPPVEDLFQAAARRQAAARPAGLGKRLAARLIDLVVIGAVTAAAAVPLGVRAVDHVQRKIDAARLSGHEVTVWLVDGTTGTSLGIVLAVLLLAGVLYEVLPTARWGRTLGKKLCGLEVRDIEGHEPPAFGAALRRWLVFSVPGLLAVGIVGVLWCLFDRPWHQCWHDKAAHTFVAG
ncbi:RDD family protein [Streptomyces argyrophyllae]|uniref:RDD family protein n=1 Tax=Streptomyces argyrophylli TaxID=2726118 RepID=A0A6M4PM14_9ACTN|nr:RDD family protein [Streptomyces argyrophyllae]QJS11694.1 RDD family protein [Streptomyces argyrophyllae]